VVVCKHAPADTVVEPATILKQRRGVSSVQPDESCECVIEHDLGSRPSIEAVDENQLVGVPPPPTMVARIRGRSIPGAKGGLTTLRPDHRCPRAWMGNGVAHGDLGWKTDIAIHDKRIRGGLANGVHIIGPIHGKHVHVGDEDPLVPSDVARSQQSDALSLKGGVHTGNGRNETDVLGIREESLRNLVRNQDDADISLWNKR